jgi:hypothetical protein
VRLPRHCTGHCCQVSSGKNGSPFTSRTPSAMLPCTVDGAGAVVNESSLREVWPEYEETIATSYAVEDASPVSSTACRDACVSTVSQSTGSLPAGPHWSLAVDGPGVVQLIVAAYDETCTGGGGGGVATVRVTVGGGAFVRR